MTQMSTDNINPDIRVSPAAHASITQMQKNLIEATDSITILKIIAQCEIEQLLQMRMQQMAKPQPLNYGDKQNGSSNPSE